MKNIQFLLICALLIVTAACKKEVPDPQEPTVIPPDPPIYVPIFEPGDTSQGAAYASKLTANWKASAYCQHSFFDENKLGITFITYNTDGLVRESVGMEFVSINNTGVYQFTTSTTNINNLPPSEIFTSYGTWASDGDVLEDYYRTDSTDTKNRLVITTIDLANKRVEGTFHVSYNLQEPRRNSANPKKVTFSEGRFWAAIRD